MGIKRLSGKSLEPVEFKIGLSSGILFFVSESEQKECLHLNNITTAELEKLRQFKNISNLRYSGSSEILQSIKDLELDWPDFSRCVELKEDVDFIYFPHSGKARIAIISEFDKVEPINKKKKVLIIDDSKTIQRLLTKVISFSDKLEVMACASLPSEAKKIIEEQRPDLITLDIHMPEMNGVEFLKSYLQDKGIPTVMISSISINEGSLVIEALSSGATSYIQKPSLEELSTLTPQILAKLEVLSLIKKSSTKNIKPVKSQLKFSSLEGLITIGSSTGGTQALQQVFLQLPSEIPPIVVVQHIPAVFSKAFADRLNTLVDFTVKEAEDGELLQKNTVYIAPGGNQLKLLRRGKELKVETNDDAPVNRFKPSVDYLFDSVSNLEVENLIAIILTGMGKDGAKGLLNLHSSGALTIAQDKDSSVVFGMPKEAIRLGAADKILSLENIANEMILQFNKKIAKAS